MDHEQCFDVGCVRGGSDGVEVTLNEFAVSSLLRLFGSPDGADVVPLEGRADLLQVLGCVAGQRDGQVEPHGDVAISLVGEAEQLLVGFVAAFAQKNFAVLQGRGVDRREPVTAIDRPCGVNELFASQHWAGQVVAKTLQGGRLDPGSFVRSVLFGLVHCAAPNTGRLVRW